MTYREVDLLIDDRCSASRQLQRVAEVVIHELAHQWFGNLVTMEWCVLESGTCQKYLVHNPVRPDRRLRWLTEEVAGKASGSPFDGAAAKTGCLLVLL